MKIKLFYIIYLLAKFVGFKKNEIELIFSIIHHRDIFQFN